MAGSRLDRLARGAMLQPSPGATHLKFQLPPSGDTRHGADIEMSLRPARGSGLPVEQKQNVTQCRSGVAVLPTRSISIISMPHRSVIGSRDIRLWCAGPILLLAGSVIEVGRGHALQNGSGLHVGNGSTKWLQHSQHQRSSSGNGGSPPQGGSPVASDSALRTSDVDAEAQAGGSSASSAVAAQVQQQGQHAAAVEDPLGAPRMLDHSQPYASASTVVVRDASFCWVLDAADLNRNYFNELPLQLRICLAEACGHLPKTCTCPIALPGPGGPGTTNR